MDTDWRHGFDVFRSPSFPSIAALSSLLLVLFFIWVSIANALYISTFGYGTPESLWTFAEQVLTTPEGHYLIAVGNSVGFAFAVLALLISAVSFPLLLDRNVGLAIAIITSVRVVLKNPVTMMVWGLIIAIGLLMGFLTLLLGLGIVLPVLGHATWHLYRSVVEPDKRSRPKAKPRAKKERHAAQFPASLIFPSSRS